MLKCCSKNKSGVFQKFWPQIKPVFTIFFPQWETVKFETTEILEAGPRCWEYHRKRRPFLNSWARKGLWVLGLGNPFSGLVDMSEMRPGTAMEETFRSLVSASHFKVGCSYFLLNQCGACLTVTPWTVAPGPLYPRDFPGKNTRVGCHFLL